LQKKLLMRMWGIGARKLWLDPNKREEILKAKTRESVRQLVAEGTIRRKFTIRGTWKPKRGPFLNPLKPAESIPSETLTKE